MTPNIAMVLCKCLLELLIFLPWPQKKMCLAQLQLPDPFWIKFSVCIEEETDFHLEIFYNS